MKKLLSLFGAISLVGTSTTSLVACNKTHEYTAEELEHLKKENQINTTDETIKNNLEWIAPQEKAFNEVDNKYYYVVWHGDEKDNWRIVKFLNNKYYIKIYEDNNFVIRKSSDNSFGSGIALNKIKNGQEVGYKIWPDINYFKSVYRWNLDIQEPELILDENGNIKVNGE